MVTENEIAEQIVCRCVGPDRYDVFYKVGPREGRVWTFRDKPSQAAVFTVSLAFDLGVPSYVEPIVRARAKLEAA